MFKNNLAKENLAVIYLRLSKEDGEKTESNSISNQREIINSYARKSKLQLSKSMWMMDIQVQILIVPILKK